MLLVNHLFIMARSRDVPEVDDTSLQFLADGISLLSSLRLDFSRCRVSFRGIQCRGDMGKHGTPETRWVGLAKSGE